jgi:glutaredoxin-related protein
MLKNPKFSTAINNVFNRIRVAEYLDSFERKQNGLRDLSKPVYSLMNDDVLNSGRTLMIKFSKFNNQLLQIQGEDQIPETNTFLFVEGTAQPASNNNQNQVSLEIASIDEKEFSTTNIIKQNQKRQELNNFVNSQTEEEDRVAVRQSERNQRRNVDRARTLRPTRSTY